MVEKILDILKMVIGIFGKKSEVKAAEDLQDVREEQREIYEEDVKKSELRVISNKIQEAQNELNELDEKIKSKIVKSEDVSFEWAKKRELKKYIKELESKKNEI